MKGHGWPPLPWCWSQGPGGPNPRVHVPWFDPGTTLNPMPILPARVPPRRPLLYSTLGPGSAVTYTAERYSYGRVGQKETQVRRPPMPGEMGPLDQGGPHACNYRCQPALPPPAVAPAPALAPDSRPLSRQRARATFCLPIWATTSKSPAPPAPCHQPPSFLSKQGLGSPAGASGHTSRALLGGDARGEGSGAAWLQRGYRIRIRVGWAL